MIEPRPVSGRSALAHRDFRLYLFGQGLSQLGTKIQASALLWHLYTLTHSPYAMGAFGLMRVGPLLVFGLVGGVVADRVDRRRLLLTTELLLAVSAFVLGLWSYRGLTSAWPIYLVSLLSGTVAAFDSPARQSLLPNIVPSYHLESAIALDSLAQKMAKVMGPLLMGVLIAIYGPALIYLMNAASYLAVIGALLLMRYRATTTAPVKTRALTEVIAAFQFIRRSAVLGPLLAMDFLVSLLGACDTMLPIFAAEVLHLGSAGYGVLAAAAPSGALLGSFGSALVGAKGNPWKRSIQATIVYGLSLVLLGISRSPFSALLALAVASAADTVGTILRNTVRHVTTPDPMRGRVAALNSMMSKTGPRLGEMEAGIVAGLIGVSGSIVLGGALCLVSVGMIATLFKGIATTAPPALAEAGPARPGLARLDDAG
jgi:MFS family permease